MSSTRFSITLQCCHRLLDGPARHHSRKPWGEQITQAIRDSSVFLLIFSGNSNESQQVLNEVVLATKFAVPVLPFRMEDCRPGDRMDFTSVPIIGSTR